MTSLIRAEAADEAQIRLLDYHLYIQKPNNIKVRDTISYLFQDFYMNPLLQVSECKLEFDLIWTSHIQAYPLSTRIIFVRKNSQLSAKI